MKVGPDAGAARDGAVGQYRGDMNTGMTEEELVAYLVFVVAQKSLAAITRVDPSLFSAFPDEFEQMGKLDVVEL